MRWAFWRRDRPGQRTGPGFGAAPAQSSSAGRAPAPAAEPDGDRRPTPAFSGASPQPGGDARTLRIEGADDLAAPLDPEVPPLDMTGVRADVIALVEAAVARDRPVAEAVLRRLDARGPDEPGMASIAAMAGLGDRLVTAAGFAPGSAAPSTVTSTAVVAQGDTVAARAEPLLRVVAPQASRDLVRLVVRFACGVPEQDPGVAHLMAAPAAELALVAAVLLAQTVLDGQGDVTALAQELAELLPG